MGYIYYDYEFKTDEFKKEYLDFLQHIDEEIRLFYSKNASMLQILITYKKLFGMTPISLRSRSDKEAIEHRNFVLYLLVHFSKEPLTSIKEYFNVSEEFLQILRDDDSLHKIYEEKTKLFFDLHREEYILNKKAQIALAEVISMTLRIECKKK